MRRRAFTMLELLLVLALIFVIASISVTTYRRQLARAKFKSGVTQIQVDLHRARILAMRSGQPYIFRCAPNASVYEIAPLNTLQEAIYRMTDVEEFDPTDPLGGSLSPSASWSDYSSMSTDPGYGARVNVLSDDLFAPENIQKDLQEAQKSMSRTARLQALAGASDSTGLGGSLTGSLDLSSANLYSSDYNSSDYGASAYGGSGYSLESDALGLGAQFDSPLGTLGNNSLLSTSVRDMNADERALATGEVLAWRVNNDGLIIRKAATDGVYFAFSRLSLSTPANLKQKRDRGVAGKDDPKSAALDSSQGDDADLGSTLGGSLRRPPSAEDSNGLLGGSLSVDSDLYDEALGLGTTAEEEQATYSVWSEPIIFFPNGKTSTAVLALASVGDFQYYAEIALRGMTGVAHVSQVRATLPGETPVTSALSPDQLMAILHPQMQTGYAESGELATTQGGALGVTPETGGALGLDPGLPLGENAALDPMANLGGSQDASQTPYGSANRRSNYQFATPSAGVDAQNNMANANPLESATSNATVGVSSANATGSNAIAGGNLPGVDPVSTSGDSGLTTGASGANAPLNSQGDLDGDLPFNGPSAGVPVNQTAQQSASNSSSNDSNSRFSAGANRSAFSRTATDSAVSAPVSSAEPASIDSLGNLDVNDRSSQSQSGGRTTRGGANNRQNGGAP